jgi:hypothetical protein
VLPILPFFLAAEFCLLFMTVRNQKGRRQMSTESKPENVTRDKLAEFLTENGFPISLNFLNAICAPSSGVDGPPIEYYWGKRPIYNTKKGLKWARARTTAAGKPGRISPPRRKTQPLAETKILGAAG